MSIGKKMATPHPLIILTIFIVISVALTWVLPAGVFDRVEDAQTGRMIVDPTTYHTVKQTPVDIFDALKSIPIGMEKAGYIIFFLFIIGGTFQIIQATGAIDAGVSSIVRKMSGKETMIIPIVMFIFSLGGSFIGNAEETLAFIPMLVAICIALGFDSITGTAIALVGAGAGFAGGMTNAFTIGIAQGISGLPLFSGIGLRFFAYVSFVSVSILYVYMYARKIKKSPEMSLMYKEDKNLKNRLQKGQDVAFKNHHKLVLLTFGITIAILVIGVLKYGFYIHELSALFLACGIVCGLVGRLNGNIIAEEFVEGAKNLMGACVIVGFAKAITVVLEEGHILDTIIFNMADAIKGFGPNLSAVSMFIAQSFINILIPSGSGQAAVTMPIMAPLADLLNITRQTAVLGFQFADAISNIITPTSGYFMAAIALSKISWIKWVRWFGPLFLIWYILSIIFVLIAVSIHYGPF